MKHLLKLALLIPLGVSADIIHEDIVFTQPSPIGAVNTIETSLTLDWTTMTWDMSKEPEFARAGGFHVEPQYVELEPEPVVEADPTPEPVVEADPTPEPVVEADPTPEPVVEADSTPEPVVEADSTPEPVVEADSTPEPVVEADSTPEPAAVYGGALSPLLIFLTFLVRRKA